MIERLTDHYVIITWNDKGQGIIEQLRNPELEKRQILIVTREREGRPVTVPEYEGVYHISANQINETLLRRANVDRAHSVLILADKVESVVAADAETILVILAVRKLCGEKSAKVPIVAELLDPQRANLAQYAGDLTDGSVEVVSSQSLCQNLIAQVAVTPGLTRVYQDLLTFGAGTNEIYSLRVPNGLIGKTLDELFLSVLNLRKRDIYVLPIAVSRGGKVFVNPNGKNIGKLEDGDLLYAIGDSLKNLKELEREVANRCQPA